MVILFIVVEFFEKFYVLVSVIVVFMVIVNFVGVVFFISILFDKKIIFEKYFVIFLWCVLFIVDCLVGVFIFGFILVNVEKVVCIIYEEMNVGVVVIIDKEKILVFIGMGVDYYLLNIFILLLSMMELLNNNKIVYLDGVECFY